MSGTNTPVKTAAFTPLASPSSSSNNTPRVLTPSPIAPSPNPYQPEQQGTLTFVNEADEKPKRSAAANFLLRQWQVKKAGVPLVTPRSGGLDAEA